MGKPIVHLSADIDDTKFSDTVDSVSLALARARTSVDTIDEFRCDAHMSPDYSSFLELCRKYVDVEIVSPAN